VELIQETPFTEYYDKCPPDQAHSPEYAVQYAQSQLSQRFTTFGQPKDKTSEINIEKKDGTGPSRLLHFHSTCATDRTKIETVLNLIQFEIVKNQLRRAALI